MKKCFLVLLTILFFAGVGYGAPIANTVPAPVTPPVAVIKAEPVKKAVTKKAVKKVKKAKAAKKAETKAPVVPEVKK